MPPSPPPAPPKKIALIIDTLNGGGAEKVCLTLGRAMVQRGINAHLIVLKKKCAYDLPASLPVHFLFDDPKIKLYRSQVQAQAANKLITTVSRLGHFDAYFSNLDACHPIVAKANLPNSFYVLHNSVENILKRTSKLGPIKSLRKRRAFAALNNKHLVTVSEGVKQEIESGGLIHPRSITTIYNPLDLEEIKNQALQQDPLIPTQDFIIYVGRQAEQKRLDILLSAFKHMQSPAALVMLGCESKKLRKLIARAKINKPIIVTPFSQNPYPWIKAAKALVLSSDYEGFGMVLAEALALGTPVASTDCPHGPGEILAGPLKNYLAPRQNPEALARVIDAAVAHPMDFNKTAILPKLNINKAVENYLALAATNPRPNSNTGPELTFYLPNYDKLEHIDTLDPFSAWREMPRGEGFWILQSYCLLRHFGVPVKISAQLPEHGVLIFHRRNKNSLFKQPHHKLKNLMLVGCRGDLHDILVPDFELLQNNYFADGERKFAMPHWPMPHIVPRDEKRGNTIKRIAFKGFAAQLHPDFQSREWMDFLQEHNIEWVQNAVTFTHDGKSQFDDSVWSDYSDVDLVIAVRPERNESHTNKPALKLYNAWIAGVPAILGKEQAYREVGISGEDYIEVTSLDDAKRAIKHLLAHPEAYRDMIEKGRAKAHLYSHQAVAKAWEHFFFTILPEKIEKRKKQWSYTLWRPIPLAWRYRLLYVWKALSFQRMR